MGKLMAVTTTEVLRFMTDCLVAAGAGIKPATQQSTLLVHADSIGYLTHGLNRLEKYVNDIISGVCKPNNEPKILKESVSTAWVDGNNVLGATASHFCMSLAVQKAKNTGVGWVSAKGSNHHGITGYWAEKAANEGLIGMAVTNSSPLMAPTRSKQAALGTNPIAVVAHGSQGETFYMDISTSAVSMGKIEMQLRKGEPLPRGWAQGPDGHETTDAKLASDTRCLMPLGGREDTAGYKGFALAAMVEIFSGILSGSKFAHHIRHWSASDTSGPANLAHCFMAINPENFAPGFGDRLTECIHNWRKLEPTDPSKPVSAPGDREKESLKRTKDSGTILYVKQLIDASAKLAKRLNVKPMEVNLKE